MNWLLLAVSLFGLALTRNAWRPIRKPAPVAVVSFFAGWLTAELALQHFAWQALLAAGMAYSGALASWQGKVAFVVLVVSCTGLARIHNRAAQAEESVNRALTLGIGADYADRMSPRVRPWLGSAIEWRKIIVPFPVRNAEVETIRNVTFARVGNLEIKLDVLRHRSHPKRCPTLVYVHGGGWVISQRRYQGIPLMQHLAARGWVCISIDYRLSPRATFPDHLVDVKRALAWVRAHAADYGADPDFIVLCGNSAGAHLASLAALTQNDPSYQPGFESADTSVSACMALYGIFDFTDRHGHWPNRGMLDLLERYVMKSSLAASPEAFAMASPIHRIHEDAPPFFVVHGDSDTLAPTDESRRFCEALRAKTRAPVVYAEIPHAQHAFEIFPSPRTAHFLAGATTFLAYVYSRHLELHPNDAHAAALIDAAPVSGDAHGAHDAEAGEPSAAT